MHRLTYRPDIDGLRTIAVLGVLFFHAGLGCQGGFVGVDVFFVISGFLITSLILRDLRQGTFSFVDFWARRIRRIVPALAVMTLAVIAVGYFGMFPEYYEALGKQVIALVLCVSNVKFWRETGYFDTASDEKPLLHTWSLSVEEQFYFIIPIALFLVFRFKREKFALPLIILTCVLSFAASVYASINHPSANFYLLPTRAWELGVGSLLAFAGPIKNPKLREFSSFIGLALIIGCYFLFPDGVSFPGASALPPVLGAALLIWSGIGQDKLPTINRFLTLKPVVGIGLISYSLYLWHWPIFAYQKHLGYSADSDAVQLSLLVISFLPAWLSWRYVETPFRIKRVFQTQRGIVFFGGGTILILISFGGLAWHDKGNLNRFNDSHPLFIVNKFGGDSLNRIKDPELPESLKLYNLGSGEKKDFIVWGDSHAEALLDTFNYQSIELRAAGIGITAGGHLPLLGCNTSHVSRTKGYDLSQTNERIKNYIIRISPKSVFLIGYWPLYIDGYPHKNYLNRDNPHEIKPKTSLEISPNANSVISLFRRSLENTIEAFQEEGIKVFVVLDVPSISPAKIDTCMSLITRRQLYLRATPSSTLIRIEDYEETHGEIHDLINLTCMEYNAASSLPIHSYLFSSANTLSLISNEKISFYRDSDHLNPYGSKILLGSAIKEWLQEAIK